MLCQKCGLNEATIHLYTAIDGKEKKLNYCQSCYQKIKKLKMEDNLKMAAAGKNPFDSGEWDQLLNLVSKYLSNIRNDKLPFPMKAILAGTNDWENDEPIKVDKHYRRKYMMSNEFLNEFGINITEIARDGGIDPVVGRDAEIQRVIEILNRRTKNNPVLIGEPGVGKTAVVEGLAQKIVNGDVPQKLQGKEIIRLDVASLVQGTGIRGQFEERMQKLIKELIRNNDAILFIDEIHEIVGAGATADNSMDAGNLLKPTLARGEVQLIGATTLNEYRIIEKDAALERRMQPVQVDEPSVEETIAILKGLQKHYEKFHHVSYTDKAIEAAVTLSNRYIQDRFLPDKAIDLLDEAGSKLNLTLSFVDPKDIEEKLEHVKKQKDKATLTEDYETAAYFRDQIKQLQELKDKEVTDQNTPVITEKEMEAIVEKKTSIPVGELKEKEQTQLIHLAEDLKKHLKGQDEAVEKVTKAIRRNRIGLGKQNHPIASFLFIGPTGVGKTELAKQLAFELFGSKDSMIRFDMSEYMEKHSISKLIGAPPGYVGYEEAGQLTEKIRRNSYSLILLDEIEKAHPDIMHAFLQILDDGRLTDAQGRTVSFKDAIIIMTSNIGSKTTESSVGFGATLSGTTKSVLNQLHNYFTPEFLNRFDGIIEFKSLSKKILLSIVSLMLNEVNEQLAAQKLKIDVPKDIQEKIVELGHNPDMGARPLRRIIQEKIEDKIADFYLEHPEEKELTTTMVNDEIIVQSKNKSLASTPTAAVKNKSEKKKLSKNEK